MAGGAGERFWPLSRKRHPKQLLPLLSDKTMIEESIERISAVILTEDIFIITNQTLLEPIRNALPSIPPENIIAEPFKRNTAPCLALGAAFIAERYFGNYDTNNLSIAVLTADQNISPADKFIKTVNSAMDYVENNNCLCTIGIKPNRPETGYGYIEIDGNFTNISELPDIKPVKTFHEKPDSATAAEFVKNGNYYWNSGMFFWRLDTFIIELSKYLPEVGSKIEKMRELYRNKTHLALPEALETISAIFAGFPNISIDYGLMEKAGNVAVAKALFDWDDVGSWDSISRFKTRDSSGNTIEGMALAYDSKNSLIYNASVKTKKIIAGIGLENMIIVVTDDSVMVCPKDRVQDVKNCVKAIEEKYGDTWL